MASYLAQKGEPTLLVEKSELGGSCVNVGCTPSKALYESVRKIQHAKTAEYAGYKVQKADFNFDKLMSFVRKIRDKSNQSLTDSLSQTENLTVMRGHARFMNQKQIQVTQKDGQQKDFSADRVFINTGSHPTIPPLEGINEVGYLTNLNIFELTKQPQTLVILGGGYIGLEFAQIFSRIGSKVSVVESSDQALSHEDADLAGILQKKLEKEGVDFHFGSKAVSVTQEEHEVHLKLENGQSLSAEKLLIAVGRTPNTKDLGLEHTDIEVDEKGHIKTSAWLETTEENVYALGEAAGSPYFTHISFDDYRIVKAHLKGGNSHNKNDRTVPHCMFTDPQLAGFGLNEKQAKEQDADYHLYSMPMSAVARAREMNETPGLIKVLCGKKGGEIIGVRILGPEAGEMMSVLQVAQANGMTADQLHDFIFTHPVLAEGFNNLFT